MIAKDEWETLCLLIEEGWPGEFTDGQAAAWRVFLDDYDAGEVLVALKALVARGGTFRPSIAEVVAQIRRDPSQPTFEEAYQLIYGRGGVLRARPPRGPYPDASTMARAQLQARRDRAAELHPLVALFVDRYGLDRLAGLEVDHETYGDLKRKELRDAWDRHCEAMEGREVAALASGARREQLGRFDPLAALGGAHKEIAEEASA